MNGSGVVRGWSVLGCVRLVEGGEMVLRPPVEPMLAQAAEAIPPVRPRTTAVAYEQKFDGHRMLVFTPDSPGGKVLLQTRRGSLIQDAFPDLVAAAERLPHGLVLDGEVVVWDVEEGRLSFEGLQRRPTARARTAPALAARMPAHYVAFDLLQQDGVELLTLPQGERRRRLEVLFAARALTAPWALCPMTTDVAKAREWLETWTDVSGVEGLVVKSMTGRYLPGSRGWTKVRRRDTTEAIIGAITGTRARPQLLVLGRHDTTGRLRTVGRTVTLRPDQARHVAEHLTPAGRRPLRRLEPPQRPRRGGGAPRPGGGDQRRPLRRPRRRVPPPRAVHPAAPGYGCR
ncbi:ATP-dependent DNA ligase [Streptomyces sp. NPDC057939]|uniref:ATP-dependent DNA ligase n=1 Tax=Streptomyces sp. NPDC057939 TaxID=3346284 RepID=UPI0036EDF7D3